MISLSEGNLVLIVAASLFIGFIFGLFIVSICSMSSESDRLDDKDPEWKVEK